MLGTQLVLALVQFSYGAITARVFVPEEFGSFVAATSLQALILLMTTTGIPSFALSQPVLTNQDKVLLRIFGIVGSFLSMGIYIVTAPSWFNLIGASGERDLRLVMLIGFLVLPIASIESSFMRRNRNAKQDALLVLSTFLVSIFISVILLITFMDLWVLVFQPILSAFMIAIFSRILQHAEAGKRTESIYGYLFKHASIIVLQNVMFSAFSQSPGWLIGMMSGAGTLGTYSRAQTLTATPGTGIATGINRALQPHWARMPSDAHRDKAISDTTKMAAALAFPLFGALFHVAPPFILVWLGDGWHDAIPLAQVLAIGYGWHIVFAVLSSNAEMLRMYSSIRKAQIWMAIILVVNLSIGFFTRDPLFTAACIATTNITGVIALLYARPWTKIEFQGVLVRMLFRSLSITAGMLILATVIFRLILPSFDSSLVEFICRGSVYCVIWFVAFRLFGIGPLLQQRGIRLPRFLYA